MKKLFLSIFALFFSCNLCFALEGISFIYINGSNNNDKKMTDWYKKGASALHQVLRREFHSNVCANKYFLKNDKYYIEKDPVIFFWGDHSKNDLSFLDGNLTILKGVSPWVAYKVRWLMAHYLHDAIWVQKEHNMRPILDKLHKEIQSQLACGRKVVLLGYSAGAFVSYEYLLSRAKFIDVIGFLKRIGLSDEELAFAEQNPMAKTCLEAFVDAKLTVQTSSGPVVINNDLELFKKKYLKLSESTDKVCAPEGSILGEINFANPFVLFYSDITDPDFELTYYNQLMYKYIIENDLFLLTVNYSEDPMGYPTVKNLTIEELEKSAKMDIEPHKGFIYDWSNTSSRKTFIGAHTSYWATRKMFSKTVVKAYNYGYRHQYDKKFQQSALECYARCEKRKKKH